MLRVDLAGYLRQPQRELALLPLLALIDHGAHALQQLFGINRVRLLCGRDGDRRDALSTDGEYGNGPGSVTGAFTDGDAGGTQSRSMPLTFWNSSTPTAHAAHSCRCRAI